MPIGPAPTTSVRSPPRISARLRGMGADRQELDQRRLVQRQPVGREHQALGHRQVVAHAAVAMHAQALQRVVQQLVLPWRQAMQRAAGEIGHQVDRRALGEAGIAAGGGDLARKLVAHHARIFEIRVLALEDVQVGAAHAHAADADDDLARTAARAAAARLGAACPGARTGLPACRGQCETRIGQAVLSRIERVTPPNIISRTREWP